MCCRHIKNLTPEASVYYHNEADAKTILKTVGKYNRLFVGGIRGFILVCFGSIWIKVVANYVYCLIFVVCFLCIR